MIMLRNGALGTRRPATREEIERGAVTHAEACERGCTYSPPPGRHVVTFGLTCLIGQGLFRALGEVKRS